MIIRGIIFAAPGFRYYNINLLKQLYISDKTTHFSYKSGCGMMPIEVHVFKRRVGLSYRQQIASGY